MYIYWHISIQKYLYTCLHISARYTCIYNTFCSVGICIISNICKEKRAEKSKVQQTEWKFNRKHTRTKCHLKNFKAIRKTNFKMSKKKLSLSHPSCTCRVVSACMEVKRFHFLEIVLFFFSFLFDTKIDKSLSRVQLHWSIVFQQCQSGRSLVQSRIHVRHTLFLISFGYAQILAVVGLVAAIRKQTFSDQWWT